MQMLPGGGYPAGAASAEWFVKDKKGKKTVIQNYLKDEVSFFHFINTINNAFGCILLTLKKQH